MYSNNIFNNKNKLQLKFYVRQINFSHILGHLKIVVFQNDVFGPSYRHTLPFIIIIIIIIAMLLW